MEGTTGPAVALAPLDAQATTNLGTCRVQQGKLSAAVQVGFPLFFCDFRSKGAEIARFFVRFNEK